MSPLGKRRSGITDGALLAGAADVFKSLRQREANVFEGVQYEECLAKELTAQLHGMQEKLLVANDQIDGIRRRQEFCKQSGLAMILSLVGTIACLTVTGFPAQVFGREVRSS
jgi:hypothetical protein